MWTEGLIKQYSNSMRELEKYRDTLDEDDLEQQNEHKVVEEMISDMRFAIEWMRKGRRPYARRGVDIKDAYSRSILMDMDLLPKEEPEPERELSVTLEEKKALVNIMLKLSPRERQCYLLHMAQGLSLTEIAKELKLKKRSVQDYVDRAKSKVAQAI
ncbi:sigma factor-like helix-turn-helix DNA-binding protein [Paenibacillus vulneris]|uniref:Sigma factor-like helix-turn-helix DNA-binding protein n=1 Tax=Paenibacillus vulneris TaxID=1133364 RepID=A0ABW3V104_9BACL